MMSILYTAVTLLVTVLWPFEQQATANAYVGASMCISCHPAIAKTQSASRHARTWGTVGRDLPGTYMVELPGHEPLEFPVKAVIGGDRFGLSFILEVSQIAGIALARAALVEGRFMQSARTGQRVLSPGLPEELPVSYMTAAGRVLSPTFAQKCLICHGKPSNNTKDSGIRCETCHGPGRDHIAAVGRKTSDLKIVSPGRLPPQGFLALCGRCHAGFSPLSDPRPDDLLISNQVTAITNTNCYLKSGKNLTCKMCHNAHENASSDRTVFEKACVSCHGPTIPNSIPCAASKTTGCVSCHMPLVKRTDSFPLRDHWIRVVERPLGENIRAKVARGAAMAERGEKQEAVRLLEGLLGAGSSEPSLFYTLGLVYEEVGRSEDALKAYQRAVQLEPDMVAAHINAGSLLLAQNRVDDAIARFKNAIEINPLDVPAHYNLAIALQTQADGAGVQRELQRVVAIDPRMKKRLQVP